MPPPEISNCASSRFSPSLFSSPKVRSVAFLPCFVRCVASQPRCDGKISPLAPSFPVPIVFPVCSLVRIGSRIGSRDGNPPGCGHQQQLMCDDIIGTTVTTTTCPSSCVKTTTHHPANCSLIARPTGGHPQQQNSAMPPPSIGSVCGRINMLITHIPAVDMRILEELVIAIGDGYPPTPSPAVLSSSSGSCRVRISTSDGTAHEFC